MSSVLLLTDKLRTGGAEQYFCKLENHLKMEDVNLYTAAGPGELSDQIQDKQSFIPLTLNNHFMNLNRLNNHIVSKEVQVIHANSLRMLLYAIALKKRKKRQLKLVYTKHNVTILEKRARSLFVHLLNNYADHIITVSNFEKENLIEMGVDRERIQTIYNGVDIDSFSFQQERNNDVFCVGILARLSPEKNHSLFLQIANGFKDDERVMFHIAGDGPNRSSIEKMIKELQLHQKVTLHGNVANPYAFLCKMDVLLLTSFREVFPMVMLEAMAAGTPLISVDVGGIKEAISNQKTGLLVPDYSEVEFVKQIRLLLANENLRKELALQAREKVEKSFTLHNMIQSTAAIYQAESERWNEGDES